MSKVTVLTSVYKSDKYLEGFLKNVKKQVFKDFEISMEINNPTENELKILSNFTKKNKVINLQVSKEVIPMSQSWNNCINNSTGEYICIWNVDDQRTRNSIKVMAKTLDKNQDIDIVYGHYYKVRNFKSKRGKLVDASKQEHLIKKGMILGPFFMFRRKLLTNSGLFDEQLFSGADYDFALRILNYGKAMYIKKNLGYFLDEGLGASTRPNSKQEIERTVVELRYSLKVLNKDIVKKAKQMYDIDNIYFENRKYSKNRFLSND
jgi:glycosyltransferase involved in cell wall biosynthesis